MQAVKLSVIAFFGLLDRPLRQPVTQHHRRVDGIHLGLTHIVGNVLLLQARAVNRKPVIKCLTVDKLIA